MNILYISALKGSMCSGPLYSVPKQISAQSKIDNVYWVNLTKISTSSRFESGLYHYYNLNGFKLNKLPKPFNKPDLIVFEEFFKMEYCLVARQAERKKIPYVIIPRCQMTQKYLENKKIKKKVASIFFFSHFAKKAKAVQFLSKQEEEDSKAFYCGLSFIAPNGIDIAHEIKKYEEKKLFVGVFIGRYSVWQKGLDILIEAISKMKQELENAHIIVNLYGPNNRTGSNLEIEELVNRYNVSNIISVNGPVYDDEKREVLLNSDFFIHTSRFEGMPMAVLEALSHGVPCLVTQGSNLREVVEEYNAGWGADNDVNSIVESLKQLIVDLNKLSLKSYNAVKLAEKYSWNNIAVEYHEYITELLSEKKEAKNENISNRC